VSASNGDSSLEKRRRTMTIIGKAHLNHVIRQHYDGDVMVLAKEVWIQTHPALIEAKKQTAHALDNEGRVALVLREMWEEVHEADYPMLDEGNTRYKTEARDRGREERLAAAKRQHDEEDHEARVTLKTAIAKYGVKVPDKIQASTNADDLDEAFGHLSEAKDQLVLELSVKYGATEEKPKFGCQAVMEGGKPHLEVTLFVSPDEIEVPPTFCEFPVRVIDGRNSESREGAVPVDFPDEGTSP
jgi:hypothetical protein